MPDCYTVNVVVVVYADSMEQAEDMVIEWVEGTPEDVEVTSWTTVSDREATR